MLFRRCNGQIKSTLTSITMFLNFILPAKQARLQLWLCVQRPTKPIVLLRRAWTTHFLHNIIYKNKKKSVRLATLLIFKSHTLCHETLCMIQHGQNNNIPDGRNKTRAEFNLGACNGTVCLIQRNSMRHSVRVTHFNVVMACRSLSVFVCVCYKECVSLVNVTHSDGTIRLYLLDLIDTDTHTHTHTQIDKTLLLNTILWPSCLRDILFQQKEKRKYENVFFHTRRLCHYTFL